MKISENDPRLTAYALGEIDDVKEREQIEAAVAESPELQKAVEGIREMGALLEASLGEESAPELSEFEKARLGQADSKRAKKSILGILFSAPALSAAAAILLVAIVLIEVPLSHWNTASDDVELAVDVVDMKAPALLEAPPPPAEEEYVAEGRGDAQKVARPKLSQLAEPATLSGDSSVTVGVQHPAVAARMTTNDVIYELADLDASFSHPGRPIDRFREQGEDWNTESYDTIEESDFRSPLVAPLSTFSIDVDTASYANVRRFINSGQLPPANAVRIEELINYFPYADKPPTKSLEQGGDPFAVHMDQTIAPWNSNNRLLRIALKGYEMPWEQRPSSNLVFLLDVSGSMGDPNKLPLVQQSMNLLVNKLDSRDRVAIVVYAGASGLVLPSTTANNRETIAHAIRNLRAGGSTNAGAGIELAYKLARQHFIEDGNNRVILCTDGDFNVGRTDRGTLAAEAEAQADKGVSLTILGFGMGNYKDGMLEELSNKGKGSYAYIDSEVEARKVFLQDLASNLFKIAKDVKIQVEFNPAQVNAYRLIGYENRRLKAEDFNNDKKKAGDIGPGHSVVALYEIVPATVEADLPVVDALKYQSVPRADVRSAEVATVKLRYKLPEEDVSKLITHSVESNDLVDFESAPEDLRFSASVAAFGMKLSESENLGEISFGKIEQIATGAIGNDPGGHRSEFTSLVRKAAELGRVSSPDKE